MDYNEKQLKLIYVLKIGYNAKDEGLYEFIFSLDHTNIAVEDWMWDIPPACDNAEAPTEEYINAIFNLKTSSFDLFCLHESVDREYMHGVYTIHALAYEIERQLDGEAPFSDYEEMFGNDNEEVPLLVFHYGMTLERVKDLLSTKKIILKGKEFVETSSIKFE